MHVPTELVEYIFEYVYDSLCLHRATSELDFPNGAKFVFSRFCLVSKTWYSISLPFLVRHFDGKNVKAFTKFVGKKKLFKAVKSMYLNAEFKGYPHPEQFEDRFSADFSDEECDEKVLAEECGDLAREENEKQVEEELKRWSTLLEGAVPSLLALEVGSRRRRKLELGTWYGDFHIRDSDGEDFGYIETAPSLDLKPFLQALPIAVNLRSLRLNLPDEEVNDRHCATEQFVAILSSRFPKLENYTLHSHSTLPLTSRLTLETLPPLRSLRLYNVISTSSGLENSLGPTYLVPSAASLVHLDLQIGVAGHAWSFNIDELFGQLQFPLLEKLLLDIPDLSCAQSDFFDRFPRIRSASIPFDPDNIRITILPVLPPTLTHLCFSGVYDSTLSVLADHLRTQDLSRLARLVIQSTCDLEAGAPSALFPDFETSDTPTVDLAAIAQICSDNQVDLCYSSAMLDDTSDANTEEEEDPSEDEDYDWDAEDGDEFRSFWSEEKKRSHDIDEGFAKFRYWIQNDEGEAKAKNAITPWLRPTNCKRFHHQLCQFM